jgi:arylsulfatase
MSNETDNLTRREFVKAAGLGGLAVGLGSNVFGADERTNNVSKITAGQGRQSKDFRGPYNILFILVDQESYFKQYPRDLRLPGHDRLKRNGISFENHSICSSVCTPSRAVIFTGQHIVHNGMFDNTNFPWAKQRLPAEIPTMGHMMRKAGYYTVYKGKWHLSADFEQPHDGPYRLLREEMEQYGFADYDSLGDLITHTLGGYHNDHLVAGNAIRWLRTRGEELRTKGQPWLMTTSLINPHDIMYFNADAPGVNHQDNGKLLMKIARAPRDPHYARTYNYPLPKTLFQSVTEKGRPHAHELIKEVNNLLLGDVPMDKSNWRRFQDYYFNCMAAVDAQINRLLRELDNLGLMDNTIVLFTADHGEMRGAHGGLRNKGQNAYEEDNHVPFIIVHPQIKGGQICRTVTTHVDIVPTVLGLAGISQAKRDTIAKNLVGKDITPLLANPTKASINDLRMGGLFAYNMFAGLDAEFYRKAMKYIGSGGDPKKLAEHGIVMNFMNRCHMRSVFDGRYKFTRYFAPKQHNRPTTKEEILKYNDIELFDLQEDPHEERNLGVDPAGNKKLILAMNEKLNALIDSEIGEDIGQMLPKGPGVSWAITKFDL